jgi:hypothetical protein
MGTHKENVDAASSPTVGWVLFGKLTSRSTTADSAVDAAGDSGAGLGVCDGVSVAGGAVGVGLGSAFEGDGSGVVSELGVTEGVGGTVGLGAYGGEAMVGVHFTRVGFSVALPLGVAGARLSDGEWVGDGDSQGEGVAVGVAVSVAVGDGVATATMAVALGLLVGLGASVSTMPAVVPANAMIVSPTRTAVSTIERWVVRSSSNAVQADVSLVLMTAPPGYGLG